MEEPTVVTDSRGVSSRFTTCHVLPASDVRSMTPGHVSVLRHPCASTLPTNTPRLRLHRAMSTGRKVDAPGVDVVVSIEVLFDGGGRDGNDGCTDRAPRKYTPPRRKRHDAGSDAPAGQRRRSRHHPIMAEAVWPAPRERVVFRARHVPVVMANRGLSRLLADNAGSARTAADLRKRESVSGATWSRTTDLSIISAAL